MKRVITALVAAVLLLSSAVTVLAENGKVTYNGASGEFIFAPGSAYSPTDLFPNFKDVMPGDSLTQKITVRNDESKNVKVNIYMRSRGAQEGSEAFLSQLRLRVTKAADNEMAYMFDAAADETADLSDWVSLGTLYSGGEVDLNVILDVPATLDNEFKNLVGYLDWEFKIEEFPVEADDPKPPQTGDNAALGVWIALLIGSAVIVILLLLFRRKEKKEEPQQS